MYQARLNNTLRVTILEKFGYQGDFAAAVGEHESAVSQVVRGRRKLDPARAKKWLQALKCDPELLRPIIKEET